MRRNTGYFSPLFPSKLPVHCQCALYIKCSLPPSTSTTMPFADMPFSSESSDSPILHVPSLFSPSKVADAARISRIETEVAGLRPSTPVPDPLAAVWATPPTIAPSSPSGPRKRARSPTKSPTFGQTKSPKKAPHDAEFKKARADKPKASCAQRMRFTIPPAKKDGVHESIMNMIASYGERIWVHGSKEELRQDALARLNRLSSVRAQDGSAPFLKRARMDAIIQQLLEK